MSKMTTQEAIQILKKHYDPKRWSYLVEFQFVDFFVVGNWKSDLMAVHGHEIKVSRSDWVKELKHPNKSMPGMGMCDYWWLAAPAGILRPGELPPKWGYLELHSRGTRAIVKPKSLRPLPKQVDLYTTIGKETWRITTAKLARRAMYGENPGLKEKIWQRQGKRLK